MEKSKRVMSWRQDQSIDKRCNEYYKVGNYFTSRKEALEVARKEIADRLALRAEKQAEEEFEIEIVDYTIPVL